MSNESNERVNGSGYADAVDFFRFLEELIRESVDSLEEEEDSKDTREETP